MNKNKKSSLIASIVIVVIAVLGFAASRLIASGPTVGVDEAYQMYQQGAFVLDVRTVGEWYEYHVPNTTLIPLDELAARVDELPRDQQIVVVCATGYRSRTGRNILLQPGFEQVVSMTGGLKKWSAKGYPIVSGP